MMKHLIAVALVLTVGLVTTSLAEEKTELKSGPQVGDKVPGPFFPMNITGEKAGQKNCLFCQNGDHPVAMIFARDASEPVVKLIKRLDVCTGKNKSAEMGSFVVFLSDSEGLDKQLKELAEKEKIQNTILSIDSPAGPAKYKVAKDADITVVLYTDRVVKANYAFKKGELKDKDISTIVADVKKIVPAK